MKRVIIPKRRLVIGAKGKIMKINPLNPTANIEKASKNGSQENQPSTAFLDILEEKVASEASPGASRMAPQKVTGPPPLTFQTQPIPPQQQALRHLEGLLDGLTNFQSQLARAKPASGEMQKAVEQLETAYQTLEPFSNNFSKEESLGGLIHQGLITARVEMIKFERGDYDL